jgi:hypothetical protein
MADEITLNCQLEYAKGGREFLNRRIHDLSMDQTGDGDEGGIYEIGTTEETITFSEISAAGWGWIQNLDGTNFVEIGSATGDYLIKLAAGEGHPIRLNKTTLYCKADTAAVEVEIRVLEE